MTDRRTHMEQIYITGSRSEGNRTHLLMACSRCSNPDIVVRGITAAAVIAAAHAHIERAARDSEPPPAETGEAAAPVRPA